MARTSKTTVEPEVPAINDGLQGRTAACSTSTTTRSCSEPETSACAGSLCWFTLYRCWVDKTPHDESRYLTALQKRHAPLLKFAASVPS
jgi:hypothetical protein